jgi:N6-adenosine-specific RNA methylase IME4
MEPFKCVAIDPPWMETGGGVIKRGADRHYPLMDPSSIIYTVQAAPVWNISDSAHLWLWATNNHLPDALTVMSALGFRYVTNLCWVKDKIGLGQYLRGQHELCLFGVRGDTMMPEIRNVPSVIHASRGRHSEKPAEAYAAIERVSPGPRLEMFARAPRSSWTTWGNEVAA